MAFERDEGGTWRDFETAIAELRKKYDITCNMYEPWLANLLSTIPTPDSADREEMPDNPSEYGNIIARIMGHVDVAMRTTTDITNQIRKRATRDADGTYDEEETNRAMLMVQKRRLGEILRVLILPMRTMNVYFDTTKKAEWINGAREGEAGSGRATYIRP